MNIREKLLLKLTQNPNYEGVDETEKALVAELKAEIEKETKGNEVDTEVKAAAKEMATQLVNMVKEMTQATLGAAQPNRNAVKGDPNGGNAEDFDAEVKAAAEKSNVNVSDEKALKEFSKAFRFSEFTKALINKDFARTKALAEGVDADGGYLVPDDFRAELVQHILASEGFRNFATVIPMSGKYLEIPKLTSDVKVYWGSENRTITTTTADFGNVVLTPFRLNAIIYTSRELFEDSAISIMDALRRRFTDRIRDEENKVFLTGNGTTQPKGISQETLRGVTAGGTLTPDHINKAYWKLPEGYRGTSRWLVNSRVMERLENAKDSNGAYLYPSLQAEVKTLKGRPVFVSDYVPSSKVWFGDVSYYYIGDRQQMTMDVTTEGASTWEKHQVGLKVVERVDGELALSQAMVEITNTGIA